MINGTKMLVFLPSLSMMNKTLLTSGRSVGTCGLKSGSVAKVDAFVTGTQMTVCGIRIERQEQDDAFIRTGVTSKI
jgi:hypothetical protein